MAFSYQFLFNYIFTKIQCNVLNIKKYKYLLGKVYVNIVYYAPRE